MINDRGGEYPAEPDKPEMQKDEQDSSRRPCRGGRGERLSTRCSEKCPERSRSRELSMNDWSPETEKDEQERSRRLRRGRRGEWPATVKGRDDPERSRSRELFFDLCS